MYKYIIPQRIIKEEKVLCSANILGDNPRQAVLLGNEGGETIDGCITIKEGGYILLDYGREVCGGILAVVQKASAEGARLRIVFGESASEAMSELGEKNSGNHHSIRDMTVPVESLSTQRWGATAFRFVRLAAVGGDIVVRTADAECDIRELEYKGAFECSDSLLNEIWKVGAYTVQLNMHEYLWDGAKRDRLVWIGDMHPETSLISAVFGPDECVEKSLDLARDLTPADKWMNNIPSYSMWWIIIHHDWYMHWGRLDYLKQQREYIKGVADHAAAWIDTDFSPEGGDSFVDWSSRRTPCEKEGVRAVFCIGMDYAAEIFTLLDEPEYAAKCAEYAQRLKTETPQPETNRRVAALSLLAERHSETTDKLIADSSAEEMSCFIGYYILKAMAKQGNYEGALRVIREYWGAMLDMGATTFWEDFDINWVENAARIDELPADGKKDIHGDFGRFCYSQFRHSLCHGWASGPTTFLSEQTGGIEILEPGCKKLAIKPQLAGLDWVKISYPTPYGIVKISARSENGETLTEVDAPEEIEIIMQ